ncbi:hypothetical protein JCM8202_004544 [Rhodotorula sphaerocarpa]
MPNFPLALARPDSSTTASTPNQSRAATPKPDLSTPRQADRSVSKQAEETAHKRTDSTSTTASTRSDASIESLLAPLFASFPVPPSSIIDDAFDDEDTLLQLELALEACQQELWAPPPFGPPPGLPLPPVPSSSESSSVWPRAAVEPSDEASPVLSLPTTFSSPLGVAAEDGRVQHRSAADHDRGSRASGLATPASPRSSWELDAITADLSQLLSTLDEPIEQEQDDPSSIHQAASERGASEDESNGVDGVAYAPTFPATPRPRAARKLGSMCSISSTNSSTGSARANTPGGYKAYKLVRKQSSFSLSSPTSSRRESSSFGFSAADSDGSSSDSEIFDLSLDTGAASPVRPKTSARSLEQQPPELLGAHTPTPRTKRYSEIASSLYKRESEPISGEEATLSDRRQVRQASTGHPFSLPSSARPTELSSLAIPMNASPIGSLRSVQSTSTLCRLRTPSQLDLRRAGYLSRSTSMANLTPLSPVPEPDNVEVLTPTVSPVRPASIRPLVTAATAQSSYLLASPWIRRRISASETARLR